jgi:hypothetical protein
VGVLCGGSPDDGCQPMEGRFGKHSRTDDQLSSASQRPSWVNKGSSAETGGFGPSQGQGLSTSLLLGWLRDDRERDVKVIVTNIKDLETVHA